MDEYFKMYKMHAFQFGSLNQPSGTVRSLRFFAPCLSAAALIVGPPCLVPAQVYKKNNKSLNKKK